MNELEFLPILSEALWQAKRKYDKRQGICSHRKGRYNAAAGRGLPAMQAEMTNMLGDIAISSPLSKLLAFPKIIALSFDLVSVPQCQPHHRIVHVLGATSWNFILSESPPPLVLCYIITLPLAYPPRVYL